MRPDEITMELLEADPDVVLAHLRKTEPVAWVPALDMWLVTRWDDVAELEADPERFTAATEPSFLVRTLGPNLLTCDPPEHTRLQKIMQAPFLAGGLGGPFVEDQLPVLADALLDEIDPSKPFDLMTEYAQPLSAGALAVMLGLDSHGFDTMWKWCEGLCTDIANFENDPERAAIGAATKAELGEAIAAHIDNADAGAKDALAWFVRGGATSEEIVNNVRLMISGGINEPRDGIGLVAWVLLSQPELRAEVEVQPRLLRRLIEEVFRVHSPVGTVTRQATDDTELAGVAIAKGDLVSGVLRSINLDEGHWTNPTEIDLHRREGSHAAFALGAHRCLGEWLGRQEVRVGVDRLLQRFPGLRLDPDHDVELHGFEFRGPRSVMVRAE
jgi:cytochrome P450